MLHTYKSHGQSGFPESAYGTRENGEGSCSWRLAIRLSGYADQPWNSPLNQASNDHEHGRLLYSVRDSSFPSKYTQIFALIGPGTAFSEFEVGNGLATAKAEPDAILLLDSKNELIHWMQPGDIDYRPLAWSLNVTGFGDLAPNYPDGFLVAFVDGAVWWIRKDVPHDVLSPFFTIEGAQQHDRDKELAPYALERLRPLEKTDGKWLFPSPDT
jgi:hypothetical protein